jgi:hypothetical protein
MDSLSRFIGIVQRVTSSLALRATRSPLYYGQVLLFKTNSQHLNDHFFTAITLNDCILYPVLLHVPLMVKVLALSVPVEFSEKAAVPPF